jgi:hypothetical protein
MLALYIVGMSYADIGKAFGHHRSTVQRIALKNNWPAKRAASLKRLEKQAETTAEAELAENLRILKTLRNIIHNKIVARVGKDGKGPLGIAEAEEVPMLLQVMRDQLKAFGLDLDGNGGGTTIISDKTYVLQAMGKERKKEIERKLLEDLDMVDPALLDEADVEEVK